MRRIPNSQNEYEGVSASRYDDLRTGDPKWEREQEIVTGYMKSIAGPKSAVLDIPVGTGRFLPLYSSLGCSVVGVDVSADMLAEAEKLRSPSQSLQVGDITRLDVRDLKIDISVCIRFANLVDLDTLSLAMKEVSRVTGSYIILGVRTKSNGARLRALVREIRNRVGRRTEKLTIHTVSELEGVVDAVDAEIVDQELVVAAADGSSSYQIYLLRLHDTSER